MANKIHEALHETAEATPTGRSNGGEESEIPIIVSHPPISTRKVRVRVSDRKKSMANPIVTDFEE